MESPPLSETNRYEIAVLGGSFNPVTVAHLAVARTVLAAVSGVRAVWLMPAYQHPFQKHHGYSNHRVAMLRLVETERVRYFGYEIDRKLSGVTYDTFSRLKADPDYEDYDFSMIIGSDCVFDFDRKWKRAGELAGMLRFIVVARPGYPLKDYDGLLSRPPHILLRDADVPDVSATELRRRRAQGEPFGDLVPDPVARYIERHGLYLDGAKDGDSSYGSGWTGGCKAEADESGAS